ncbi:c-type cytochrome [Billgrantia aerodenitrificans]|uniref:C-type cytochrome n=1 Tax=Billgrantia aerodenitrificans TaxID=2733483 RepID=A0ABS9ANW0_9GAMM|nr:c-type cytochrome [Halomonas aerodenitrificans]MCE8023430.1 c-type cytochrome [Halomonas aerodenitrificans]
MATILNDASPFLSGQHYTSTRMTGRATALMVGMLLTGVLAPQVFAHDEPEHTHATQQSMSHADHADHADHAHDHGLQEHVSEASHDHDHDHDHHDHASASSDAIHDHADDEHDHDHDKEASHADHAHEHAHDRDIPDEWATQENPLPLDAATLAEGQRVYEQFCSACHGPAGRGDGVAPAVAYFDPSPTDLAQHGPAHGAAEYAWVINAGNPQSAMPRFGTKLNENEIWSVVHYIRHGLSDEQDEQYAQAHQH